MSDLSRKIAIAVAPAARHADEKAERYGTEDVFYSVMTPEEIATDVIECAKEGATVIHMHVRDENGHLTNDLTQFKRTIALVKAQQDVIIEGSTGGVSDLTAEERASVLSLPDLEISAINMGSVNLGEAAFINEPEDIRMLAIMMRDHGVVPIMECFELGMLETVDVLVAEGIIRPPYVYGIPLGFAGTQPARVANLQAMVGLLPKDAVWYYQQHGMKDLSMIAASVAAGAKIVRVGYEDSIYYAPGRAGKSNAELVRKVAELIRLIGYEIATPDEARQLIGLK
ncbi:MAG: 3-keto-5-aminohexanoate cleavage protein [Christensenellales bacterium]|jgi:3-keto-5-aminohexanoate cleavage enzyme